jgi:hypothetical protein
VEFALVIGWALSWIGFLWFCDRKEGQMAAERERVDAAHAEERRKLLNRLMAPETAAYEATGEPSEEPLYVPFEDDVAHEEYVERRMAGELN